jgi:hypothetical protein
MADAQDLCGKEVLEEPTDRAETISTSDAEAHQDNGADQLAPEAENKSDGKPTEEEQKQGDSKNQENGERQA